jgi:hypothetical protein
VVAQPLRRAEELVTLWLCVAPLRLGGLRGKKSTPSVWLGGTGESSTVGTERERHGARTTPEDGLEATVWFPNGRKVRIQTQARNGLSAVK